MKTSSSFLYSIFVLAALICGVSGCTNVKEELVTPKPSENTGIYTLLSDEDVRNLGFGLAENSGRNQVCSWSDGWADAQGNTSISCDGGVCRVVSHDNGNGVVSTGLACFQNGIIFEAGLFR